MVSKRLHVLKNRSDFQNIFKNGKRVRVTAWLLLNFIENEHGYFRCGWTLPRNVGSAVTRNRLKRWSREYFRSPEFDDSQPLDINLVFRPNGDGFYRTLDFEKFSAALEKGLDLVRRRI